MRSKYDYNRTFCEVCGGAGPCVSREGWSTCFAHHETEKPEHPLFDWRTGEPIDPPDDPAS